jgi:hypothetical protein
MPPHDRLDLARVLLTRAVDDEKLVRKVCLDADVADSIVGFHAQQAAEKLIKAVLAARGVTLWTDLRPSSWSHSSERGLNARSRPQTSRQTLTNNSRMGISQSRTGASFE